MKRCLILLTLILCLYGCTSNDSSNSTYEGVIKDVIYTETKYYLSGGFTTIILDSGVSVLAGAEYRNIATESYVQIVVDDDNWLLSLKYLDQ